MLVSLPVGAQTEKDGPFSDKQQTPPPTALLSDTSSLKAKGPSFPGLGPGSRRKTLSPGNNQEAQDRVDAGSACCASAFGPCVCPRPGKDPHTDPALLKLLIMSSGLELSTSTE